MIYRMKKSRSKESTSTLYSVIRNQINCHLKIKGRRKNNNKIDLLLCDGQQDRLKKEPDVAGTSYNGLGPIQIEKEKRKKCDNDIHARGSRSSSGLTGSRYGYPREGQCPGVLVVPQLAITQERIRI